MIAVVSFVVGGLAAWVTYDWWTRREADARRRHQQLVASLERMHGRVDVEHMARRNG